MSRSSGAIHKVADPIDSRSGKSSMWPAKECVSVLDWTGAHAIIREMKSNFFSYKLFIRSQCIHR